MPVLPKGGAEHPRSVEVVVIGVAGLSVDGSHSLLPQRVLLHRRLAPFLPAKKREIKWKVRRNEREIHYTANISFRNTLIRFEPHLSSQWLKKLK